MKIRFPAAWLAAGLGAATLGWVALPRPPLLDEVSFSRAFFDREGHLLRLGLSADEKFRLFTPRAELPEALVRATLRQEDRYYGRHPGVNPGAVARSVWQLLSRGRAGGGASTLAMQVARLRYRLHTRSAAGKLGQMVLALRLTRHYSRGELLTAYFNLAPYGGNVEGVGAASWRYFGKPPGALSGPEALALSVIPQSPSRRTPRVGRANPAWDLACRRLARRLADTGGPDGGRSGQAGPADPLAAEFSAVAAPPPAAARLAPHFLARAGQLVRAAPPGPVTTTLDPDLQATLVGQVTTYVALNGNRGVHNAAALLVDVASREVLAQVGSADFDDPALPGQVDGTLRRRSPGSALKPFVYALALDEGLIHPRTVLADAPRRFDDYAPENFDRRFVGPLTASEALVRSRNVPAVALAAGLRTPSLDGFLRSAGVRLAKPPGAYGLGLALGGTEVTAAELAGLYAALADGGRWRPLRWVAGAGPAPPGDGVRVLSPEAAYLTLRALRDNPPPEPGTAPGRVAWKTGTSAGFRDAWAIVVFDRFVLVTWVGRFDGRGNPAFVGRTCAGPLAFRIVGALCAQGLATLARPDRTGEDRPPAGLNLRRVTLCAVSGQLPTAACRDRVDDWFIPGVSPVTTCQVHREVLLDAATGLRVPADDGTRPLRREVYEFWPSDLRELFREAGMPRKSVPPFLPSTDPGQSQAPASNDRSAYRVAAGGAGSPRIVSPGANLVCLGALPGAAGAPGGTGTIPLRARAGGDATLLSWFADGAFLGSCPADGELLWTPRAGTYLVAVADDLGRTDVRRVDVQIFPEPAGARELGP